MKKRGVDAAIEIDRLLDEYNPYYDAQLNFLLKKMVRENDRRQYDYKKKIEQTRQDFREGKGVFAERRRKDRKFGTGTKPPWEIEKEKRKEERKKALFVKMEAELAEKEKARSEKAERLEAKKDKTGTDNSDNNEVPASE